MAEAPKEAVKLDEIKKLRDESKIADDEMRNQRQTGAKGMYRSSLNEGDWVPVYDSAPSEKVVEGANNSFIILGRDSGITHQAGGWGGQGGTGCGAIDIVVGLGGEDYKEFITKKRAETGAVDWTASANWGRLKDQDLRKVQQNAIHDAARIYLTEKGNIDSYLGLAQGTEMLNASKGKSAVGIKADHVRILGSEHIKIITGKMRLDNAGFVGEKNSRGGDLEFPGQIDFIAGNYTDAEEVSFLSFFGIDIPGMEPIPKLQPVVKGKNLSKCIEDVYGLLTDLNDMVHKNSLLIGKLAIDGAVHVHGSAVGPTTPDGTGIYVGTAAQTAKLIHKSLILGLNVAIQEIMYLCPFFTTYINSRYVNTT